jgi:hypothetical protein
MSRTTKIVKTCIVQKSFKLEIKRDVMNKKEDNVQIKHFTSLGLVDLFTYLAHVFLGC